MKKVVYLLLLLAELFVGTLLMIALCQSGLYIACIVIVLALVALLIRQIFVWKKADDDEKKRKVKLNIFLIMLLPIAAFFATYVLVAIAFVFAFV